jgi:hypothetical protein
VGFSTSGFISTHAVKASVDAVEQAEAEVEDLDYQLMKMVTYTEAQERIAAAKAAAAEKRATIAALNAKLAGTRPVTTPAPMVSAPTSVVPAPAPVVASKSVSWSPSPLPEATGIFVKLQAEAEKEAAAATKAPKAKEVVKAPTPAVVAEPKEETPKSSRRGTVKDYKLSQVSYDQMYEVVAELLDTVATNIVCGIKGLSGKDTYCLKYQAKKNPKAYNKYYVFSPLKLTPEHESGEAKRFEEAAAGGFTKHFPTIFADVGNAQRAIRHTLVAAALLGELAFSQGHDIKCKAPLAERLSDKVFSLLTTYNLEATSIKCITDSRQLTLKVEGLRVVGGDEASTKTPGPAVSASAPVSGDSTVKDKKAPKPYLKAAKAATGGEGSEPSSKDDIITQMKAQLAAQAAQMEQMMKMMSSFNSK